MFPMRTLVALSDGRDNVEEPYSLAVANNITNFKNIQNGLEPHQHSMKKRKPIKAMKFARSSNAINMAQAPKWAAKPEIRAAVAKDPSNTMVIVLLMSSLPLTQTQPQQTICIQSQRQL